MGFPRFVSDPDASASYGGPLHGPNQLQQYFSFFMSFVFKFSFFQPPTKNRTISRGQLLKNPSYLRVNSCLGVRVLELLRSQSRVSRVEWVTAETRAKPLQ